MIARALAIFTVLALSTCAATAQHRHHAHHKNAVAHHHVIPADAFAQAWLEAIPLPRPRPFDALWYDRVTSVIGGGR
jgi:hypothetical protein